MRYKGDKGQADERSKLKEEIKKDMKDYLPKMKKDWFNFVKDYPYGGYDGELENISKEKVLAWWENYLDIVIKKNK